MGAEVYANGNAIACKAGDGKVIASFPDVCLSPPSPPAGPVPVPYPDTSFSKDAQNGSKTVSIKGSEVMLKDQSFYKTSPLGDEAATQGLGANILSHVITGKTYFVAWSMDVKFEGANVDRHIDLTTSNHASYPAGVMVPNPDMEKLALERIAEKKCPCCGKTECPAAFKDGEEPLGFKEFYKLDEFGETLGDLASPPKSPAKRKLPSPGGKARDKHWQEIQGLKAKCTQGCKVYPDPPCDVFRKPDSARTAAIETHWQTQRAAYVANYNAAHGTTLVSEQINHLTPKQAGGCPDNPQNLQPQPQNCEHCQKIDGIFTNELQ